MTNYSLNLAKVEDYLLDLMPRTGQILRRYFHAENLIHKKKGKLDYVTAADLAVDKFLTEALRKVYKGIPVLTEETAPEDYARFVKEKLVWIVDPLDGTTNFSRGNDNFSISVALVSYGQPLAGTIFAPVSSRLFWARADKKGAYWNGRRIGVSTIADLDQAVVATDWSHFLDTRNATTDFLKKVFHHVRQIKILGSAATDITLLARGGVDIYHHVHLLPWDVAAAGLIAQKAGAKVTDMDGGEWNVFTPGILAANPLLHRKILELLQIPRL